MRRLEYFSGIILFFLFMIFFSLSAMAIGVQPLTLDFTMTPGERKDFSLILSSSGMEESVSISIYQSYQDFTGNLAYRVGDLETFPEMGWVELEKNNILVPVEGEVELKGSIGVPFGTRPGSYVIILMVEPEASKTGDGISLIVRYAVRLIVRVDGPNLRERGRINFLQLEKDENGNQVLVAEVENNSQLDYLAGVEVTIRDENRSLVERLVLRTIAAERNQRDFTRIYPGSRVLFIGKPENYLYPGNYELRALMSYGERGKVTFVNDIRILPGQFPEPVQALNKYFTLKPEMVNIKLKPGQRYTETFEIKNIFRESIYIKTEVLDIEEDYKFSLIPWLRLHADDRLALLPRQSRQFLKILQVPIDAAEGGYYALLKLKVYEDESLINLLDEKIIPISCLVGKDGRLETQIKGFEFINQEEQAFLLLLKNIGQVHLKPRVKLNLLNKAQESLGEIELESEDLIEGLLFPGKEVFFKGVFKGKLEEGEYNAVIEVLSVNNSIQNSTYTIYVE
ncbi:MAG: hypothetical protein WBI32_08295 [Halanaerobiales bacterium]|nr:hypothetical protein [Halanaerobiales bacterium]HPZ61961.1 hypothetical protein [Halanaerobiales bacterium]HQD03316.1 hypothetical protein [Halanaerobiales bacterium]